MSESKYDPPDGIVYRSRSGKNDDLNATDNVQGVGMINSGDDRATISHILRHATLTGRNSIHPVHFNFMRDVEVFDGDIVMIEML